ARELDQDRVAGRVEDAPVAGLGHAAKHACRRGEAGDRRLFGLRDEPAVAGDVGRENDRQFPAHARSSGAGPTRGAATMAGTLLYGATIIPSINTALASTMAMRDDAAAAKKAAFTENAASRQVSDEPAITAGPDSSPRSSGRGG